MKNIIKNIRTHKNPEMYKYMYFMNNFHREDNGELVIKLDNTARHNNKVVAEYKNKKFKKYTKIQQNASKSTQ